MKYELIEYKGVGPATQKRVIATGNDVWALYEQRDGLNLGQTNLSLLRYGVSPV